MACEAEEPMAAEETDAPAGGKADDAEALEDALHEGTGEHVDPSLRAELTRKWGVRPRMYRGFFNRSNEAEGIMLDNLGDVLRDVETRAANNGYDNLNLTEAALATNFITEGGYYPLDDNRTTGLSGFGAFGIDTIVDNQTALRSWLHTSVNDLIDDSSHHSGETNELGESVTSLDNMTLLEGLYANAGVFAWSCAQAIDDAGDDWDDLDEYGQFFWCTVYYNAGPGRGEDLMADEGLDWYENPWQHADDHWRYGSNARFNALWRTSSFEYMFLAYHSE